MGRLGEHDIPSEAIPKVFEIQKLRDGYEPLTIREAKWVGRLHVLTQDIMELAIWAALYAEREKFCERVGIEKDTSDIDAAVRSKFVTILGYFPWLFQKDWVPDSCKIQVAEAETLKYEKVLKLDLNRPDLTLNGWLVYAHILQGMVLWHKEEKDLPKEFPKLRVLGARQVAKNEGRVLFGVPVGTPVGAPGKYIDLLEAITNGVVREKSYSHLEEVFDVSSTSEVREEIDKLLGARKIRSASAREG